MKLYLVRHGITDWNVRKKIQGQVDIPLNETGRDLARKTAEGLKDVPFDLCMTSPLCRAKETARIILGSRNVNILDEPRLMEMAFGDYEGKCCSREGWELPEGFHKFFDDPAGYEPPRGGESFADVKKRTGAFLADLYQKPKYQGLNILITTHGAALAGLLNNIKQEPLSRYWGDGVHRNCAVTEVEVRDGVPEILSENVIYYENVKDPWADEK